MRAGARKGISIKGTTYDRLRAFSEQTGRPMSSWIEQWVNDDLQAKGVPEVDPRSVPQRPYKPRSEAKSERDRRKYFTW